MNKRGTAALLMSAMLWGCMTDHIPALAASGTDKQELVREHTEKPNDEEKKKTVPEEKPAGVPEDVHGREETEAPPAAAETEQTAADVPGEVSAEAEITAGETEEAAEPAPAAEMEAPAAEKPAAAEVPTAEQAPAAETEAPAAEMEVPAAEETAEQVPAAEQEEPEPPAAEEAADEMTGSEEVPMPGAETEEGTEKAPAARPEEPETPEARPDVQTEAEEMPESDVQTEAEEMPEPDVQTEAEEMPEPDIRTETEDVPETETETEKVPDQAFLEMEPEEPSESFMMKTADQCPAAPPKKLQDEQKAGQPDKQIAEMPDKQTAEMPDMQTAEVSDMQPAGYGEDFLPQRQDDLSEETHYLLPAGTSAEEPAGEISEAGVDPGITISGVKEGSANNGAVQLCITCRDSRIKKGSVRIVLEREGKGETAAEIRTEESGDGESWIIQDLPHLPDWDDRYSLRVQAETPDGSQIEKKIDFSVNRFGSVLEVGEETQEALASYYHTGTVPVVFTETNLDEITSAELLCSCDGKVRTLVPEKEYTVEKHTDQNRKNVYRYTVSSQVFRQEGTYELLLISSDRAQNSQNTVSQKQMVAFAIDRTPPVVCLPGIEDGGVYDADEVWYCMEAWDNLSLDSLTLYLDGRAVKRLGRDELEKSGGLWKFRLTGAGRWQRIRLHAVDGAGNDTWSAQKAVYIAPGADRKKIPPCRASSGDTGNTAETEEQNRENKKKAGTGLIPVCAGLGMVLLLKRR